MATKRASPLVAILSLALISGGVGFAETYDAVPDMSATPSDPNPESLAIYSPETSPTPSDPIDILTLFRPVESPTPSAPTPETPDGPPSGCVNEEQLAWNWERGLLFTCDQMHALHVCRPNDFPDCLGGSVSFNLVNPSQCFRNSGGLVAPVDCHVFDSDPNLPTYAVLVRPGYACNEDAAAFVGCGPDPASIDCRIAFQALRGCLISNSYQDSLYQTPPRPVATPNESAVPVESPAPVGRPSPTQP